MKQFKEKKYFYPVVITGAVVIALVILRLLGFRITYTEPNWNAISSWASWASVGASFIAIWFAIQVPKTIADRQDKIALFDKRFEVFEKIENYINRIEFSPLDFEYGWFLNLSLSEKQVRALFDEEFGDFFNELKQKSLKIEDLMGDYENATTHGTCNRNNIEKTEHEIEMDIRQVVLCIKSDFQNIEDKIYTSYLKL